MRLRRPGAGLVLLAGVLLAPVPAHALRCGTSLVSVGDYAYEVRQACGEPDAVQPLDDPHHRDYGPSEERWYYDFGDNRFLRVLHFREGRLRRIETSDRGLGAGEGDRDCRPNEIAVGMSSYRLLRICGEPVQRERRHVRRKPAPDKYPHWVTDVLVEKWIYDFGSTYLARIVRLEDGEVVSVDTR
jgi:hypothetical protein